MFINRVMEIIWESLNKEYREGYKTALNMGKQELFRMFAGMQMGVYQYPGVNMNLIPTPGCPHRYRREKASGCSMCNYHSFSVKQQGALLAMREMDEKLYSDLVRSAFVSTRGEKSEPSAIEFLSACDIFDPFEMPDEMFDKLFKDANLYSTRPFRINVEARASSITPEGLKKIKDRLPSKTRVGVEFGVEVADEWIRNHWINKNVKNSEIVNSVQYIHDIGYKATGDVILGIPGMAEKMSYNLFTESVYWLDDIGIDEIIVLPLNRKSHTLHNFIYERLLENKNLQAYGLVQGEHTGLPWLFTIVDALDEVLKQRSGLRNKIKLAQLSEDTNSIENTICYNNKRDCNCYKNIYKSLRQMQTIMDPEILHKLKLAYAEDPCYREYNMLINKQENIKDLRHNMKLIADAVRDELSSCYTNLPDFDKELETYN